MKLNHVALLVLGIVALLIMMTPVQAAIWFDVNPSSIPQNEKVTIVIVATSGENVIDKIKVIGPDGAIYIKDYVTDPVLYEGDTLSEDFGTGVGGWSPDADTSIEGWYEVVVFGYTPGLVTMQNMFGVTRLFHVPEFIFPSIILTVAGFVLFNAWYGLSKRKKSTRD